MITFLKKYRSIPKYLERFTILKISNFHIRIHKILSEDKTPFYHNHPFHFLSIVINGGYTEEILHNGKVKTKQHNSFAFIFRNKNTYHKIASVKPNTKTLFFAIGNTKKWNLKSINNSNRPENGLYKRIINSKEVYSKCSDGMFYIGSSDIDTALNENRLSIYQDDTDTIIYKINI
jgi:hypothetical protein